MSSSASEFVAQLPPLPLSEPLLLPEPLPLPLLLPDPLPLPELPPLLLPELPLLPDASPPVAPPSFSELAVVCVPQAIETHTRADPSANVPYPDRALVAEGVMAAS